MNLKEYPRPHYAINQFTQPHCTELCGKKFHFVMDNGFDVDLDFTGPDTVNWSIGGSEPKEATYECLKGDETTYLVDYDVRETLDTDHRTNHLFVIDLEQRLVTKVICSIGDNPRFPYLVKSEYDFGAIETEGHELTFIRHCFTTDMVGTRVEWHWNTSMRTHHNYFSAAFYRLTWPEDSSSEDEIGEPFQFLPSHDEVSRYIKIKDKMYLYCLTEELQERVLNGKCPFRSNNMIFLQNYERMRHVGRTFGSIEIKGKVVPCRTLFGAFGNPLELPEKELTAYNAFTV